MYITVCTLHFCITRFEGKISDLIELKSGGLTPTPKSVGSGLPPIPRKITPICVYVFRRLVEESHVSMVISLL